MPPILAELAVKYGSRALATLALLVSLVAGYYYWKHQVYSEATAECNESKEKFRIDAEHFKLARLEEVNKLNAAKDERLKNAIQIYADHYESLRAAPVATSLRVKTNQPSTCGNSVPGTNKGRYESKEGTVGVGETELPAGNLQRLNTVMTDVEHMQLLCERILNEAE